MVQMNEYRFVIELWSSSSNSSDEIDSWGLDGKGEGWGDCKAYTYVWLTSGKTLMFWIFCVWYMFNEYHRDVRRKFKECQSKEKKIFF